jgi:protein-S-isoprenylcysteine O-methyltransferase Ste14
MRGILTARDSTQKSRSRPFEFPRPGWQGAPRKGSPVALKDELADTGNTLFRWRSYLPLVFLPVLLYALSDFSRHSIDEKWGEKWEVVCLVVSMSGLLVRALVVGQTPHRTSGRNTTEQVADRLNTTGMYSIVRHPLYVGNFLSWLGIALFPQSFLVLLVCVMAFALYYERIMLAEEKFLANKFQGAFHEWAERTPAFFPNLGRWKRSRVKYSWRMVLRREYSGFFAIVVTFTFLDVMRGYFERGWIRLEPGWAAFLAVGTAIYVALRWAKKSGKLPLEM